MKENYFLNDIFMSSNLSQHVARKFLDDEAELSEEDAEYVSSDENDESENEEDSSLLDFLNDETQLSQAINGKCYNDPSDFFQCLYVLIFKYFNQFLMKLDLKSN